MGGLDPELKAAMAAVKKAVAKRRALPNGYALFVIVARAPTADRPGSMAVSTTPPQTVETVAAVFRKAVASFTGETSIHAVDGSVIPTGNA